MNLLHVCPTFFFSLYHFLPFTFPCPWHALAVGPLPTRSVTARRRFLFVIWLSDFYVFVPPARVACECWAYAKKICISTPTTFSSIIFCSALITSPCSRHIVDVGSMVTELKCTSAAFSSISSFAVYPCRSQQDDGEGMGQKRSRRCWLGRAMDLLGIPADASVCGSDG